MAIYKIRLNLELDEPSGVYTVTSPDVPGLVTVGRTMDKIMENVQDAINCLIDGLPKLGKELPPALRSENALQPESTEVLVTA